MCLSPYLLAQQHTAAAQWWQRTHCCEWHSPWHQLRSRGPAAWPRSGDPAGKMWPASSSASLSSDMDLRGSQRHNTDQRRLVRGQPHRLHSRDSFSPVANLAEFQTGKDDLKVQFFMHRLSMRTWPWVKTLSWASMAFCQTNYFHNDGVDEKVKHD